MARHRNVRKMNYDEECDYDDVYGRSVEEEYCISPGTAAQFMYDRSANTHDMGAYIKGESDIAEEEHESDEDAPRHQEQHKLPQLNPMDEARLRSCLEELRNVVGDNISESVLIEAVLKHNFNFEPALDAVLSAQAKPDEPKPQRERHERRPRGGDGAFTFSTNITVADSNKRTANGDLEHVTEKVGRLAVDQDTAVQRRLSPGRYSEKGQKEVSPVRGTEQLAVADQPDPRLSPNLGAQRSQRGLNTSSPLPPSASSRIDAKAEYDRQRADGKELLNLVVIGHVDAGKSTLMGHLLWMLGAVSKKAMHKYEQESKKIGKASFMYAWVLDETGEERSRGITMDVGQFKFETETKIVTLLDAPGHKDFIPNMITGASQADVAILVVDASRGEFETGFDSGGQTREHALLVRSLGVSQLVVVVNKLDTVKWSPDRFNDITKKLGQFLKQSGFKEADVSYVPCSGLTGENLIEEPKEEGLSQWYNGPTLLKRIDNFRPPERPVSKPFRMTVGDVFKGQGSGFCVAGRVETGFVQNGDRVLVMPQGEVAQAKGITMDDMPIPVGFAGDQVTVTVSNIDMTNVTVGSILCDPSHPIRTTTSLQARIVVFNIDIPITKGFPVVFHFQSMSEPAVIKKLICQLHKTTGEVVKKKPKCLLKHSNALIVVEVSRPVCVELYKDVKELGRFMLRSGGSTIAAGLVTEIL